MEKRRKADKRKRRFFIWRLQPGWMIYADGAEIEHDGEHNWPTLHSGNADTSQGM